MTVCIAAVFADAYRDVNVMINSGYVKYDPESIRAISDGLTQDQKESIYMWRHVSPVGGALFNAVMGFGSGSFSQGDTGHGIIFLCGDTICTGLIIYDILRVSGENIRRSLYGDGAATDEMPFALAGLIGALVLRIWQTIRPIQYARNYNSKLAYSLNLDSPKIAFVPLAGDIKTEVTISATISF